MGRGRWKHELSWSCLFESWQKGTSSSLKPSRERTEKQIEKRKKASGIETNMSSIEVALEEFSVLFVYSRVLMSLLQI